MSKITILIPCYNDWSCLNELIPQIDKSLEEIKKDANVIIVNDCSTIKHTLNGINCKNITLKILNLRKNVRAQIAIASGIEYLNKQNIEGNIIVMDADGQDNPNLIPLMYNYINQDKYDLITINRKNRSETFLFQLIYYNYLVFCLIFLFKNLSHGVFVAFKSSMLKTLVKDKECNLAFTGAINKKSKKIKSIYAVREKRYKEKSKHNYFYLITYALSIISTFRVNFALISIFYLTIFILIQGLNIFSYFLIFIFIITNIFFNFFFFIKTKKHDYDKSENVVNEEIIF